MTQSSLAERFKIDGPDFFKKRRPYDLLVSACGGDDRSYQILGLMAQHKVIRNSILFDYKERRTHNARRYRRFQALVNSPHLLDCSEVDRTCDMREFIQTAKAIGGLKRVAVDISVFTKPFFFAVLRALKVFLGVQSIDVLYTEPATYLKSYKLNQYEFTVGHHEAVDIPGFSGERITRNQRLLVILLGFEGRVTLKLWEDLSPNTTFLVNGFPAYLLHYKDVSLLCNEDLISGGHQVVYAPANDPFETYNVIDKICGRHVESAITLAPLGPKPMALGAAFYALSHESVRVAYPLPKRYNSTISKGCGESWLFPLNFKRNED